MIDHPVSNQTQFLFHKMLNLLFTLTYLHLLIISLSLRVACFGDQMTNINESISNEKLNVRVRITSFIGHLTSL